MEDIGLIDIDINRVIAFEGFFLDIVLNGGDFMVNKKFFSFGEFNLILLINPNPAYLTLVRYAFLITTSLSGLLLASTSTAAILSTTLSPSYTCPNTV